MKSNNQFLIWSLILVFGVLGCQLSEVDQVDINFDGEYAIPLINTSARILDIADNTSTNATVKVDTDGRLTVFYTADTVRRVARDIFQPVEVGLPIFINDSVAPIPLPVDNFPDSWVLNRATLNNMGIRWFMTSNLNEEINVEITIPEVTKDGVAYTNSWTIPSTGGTITTEYDDLDGWEVQLQNNEMNVIYYATRPNGERILLDELIFQFDRLDFGYIEGFFGREENPIMGNVITVGAYSNWLSGGLWFEDPKVNIKVENAFGFPVQAQFNEVRFTTIDNNVWSMEGEFIDNGVQFDYPSLSEVGEVKSNEFVFTSDNSNIQQIFNEKVSEVFFDINAIGNPDDDPSIIGFMTEDSYYQVITDVEMPLLQYANNLKLTDTVDLNFEGYDQVNSAEFKLVMENDFPFDLDIQMYFEDSGVVSDSLFENSYFLPAAEIGLDGEILSRGSETELIPFDTDRFNKIIGADKVFFIVKVVSLNNGTVPLWIYDDYALDLKLGAKLTIAE